VLALVPWTAQPLIGFFVCITTFFKVYTFVIRQNTIDKNINVYELYLPWLIRPFYIHTIFAIALKWPSLPKEKIN